MQPLIIRKKYKASSTRFSHPTFAVMFFWEAPQFLKIRQPSELPGVRSLNHGGMRQETRLAVLMAQLCGYTLTKCRTLCSTT